MSLNLPTAIYGTRWLVRDTFRQARASGITALMLAVSALCVLVCLSVHVTGTVPLRREGELPEFLPSSDPQAARAKQEGMEVPSGELTLAFGAIRVQQTRDAAEAIHFLQALLANGVAGTAGLLLALIWTAGFLPTFLEPSAASVLLAKPLPRWSILVGKFAGVLAFLGFQALVFVAGTWAALGLRTGIWDMVYFLCLPLLLLQFIVFFSFSALLAVCTRSTVACVFGSVLFWTVCWGMNYGRHAVVGIPEVGGAAQAMTAPVEVGYWVLPKPADLSMVLSDALHADRHFAQPPAFRQMREAGAFYPELSVLTSLAFGVLLMGVAARQFMMTDY